MKKVDKNVSCPLQYFFDILKNQEFIGSTLDIYKERNICNTIKNLFFTEILRIKIYLHNKKKCQICKNHHR